MVHLTARSHKSSCRCNGVHNVFPDKPPQFQRLYVSGRWVQDVDQIVPRPHDPWNEIHPASDIHKIS